MNLIEALKAYEDGKIVRCINNGVMFQKGVTTGHITPWPLDNIKFELVTKKYQAVYSYDNHSKYGVTILTYYSREDFERDRLNNDDRNFIKFIDLKKLALNDNAEVDVHEGHL